MRFGQHSKLRAAIAGAMILAFSPVPVSAAEAKLDFTKDIQPIFKSHCYECHSSAKQKSGFRLDDKKVAFRGGDSGKPSLIPGKGGESPLIKRVTAEAGSDDLMPPKGDRLTPRQVALLKEWIDQGASWPDSATPQKKHWAYVKPVRPELPKVQQTRWPRNEIDYFVLAKLESGQMRPAPEADRAALMRRVCLDLTGLPPTLKELEAFLSDHSDTAYEKLVDRLLASPHYGEKWAREWLDLARYADTHGYEKDPRRSIWPYRDWVINALNADMPFDQFTIEQLAGDMLPDATQDQKIASGFHRNTMFNTEGGVDPEQSRTETIIDRVNTTASVWLGTTLGCAQCHSHKYDPFSQKEYYEFYAFFNNCDEPQLEVPSAKEAKAMADIAAKISNLEKELKADDKGNAAELAAWESAQLAEMALWKVLKPLEAASTGGATLKVLDDDSVLASGRNPSNDTYTVALNPGAGSITGLRLEVLPDESLPEGSIGRHPNGSFVITGFEASLRQSSGKPAEKFALKTAAADFTQEGHDVNNLIDGKPGKGWAIAAGEAKNRVRRSAYFELEKPLVVSAESQIVITLKNGSEWPEANVGRFRISTYSAKEPLELAALTQDIQTAIALPANARTEAQRKAIEQTFRKTAPQFVALQKQIDRQRRAERSLKKEIPTTLVMTEREKPRETHVFFRGNFLNPGDQVWPATPEVLNPWPSGEPTNRLGLAHWLVSADNPLTARVAVNRMWEQFFGHGLVETVEDFGTQGDLPTHPGLLDWLATEFVRNKWDVKAMHKLIVMSSAYRQTSRVTPAETEEDPYNKLLSRGPRFRVPAESVRDIALEVSGLLSPKVGGPSVFPYQPDGIWTQLYSSDKWETSKGEDKYRRGLYTFWRRTSPYPSFMSFDSPSRELICTRRPRTDTPLQALTTLNDPAFVEAAQAFARRIVTEGGGDAKERITYAFRVCLSRLPQKNEENRLMALYEQERKRFENDPSAAEKLATSELGKPSQPANYGELAAWTVVANVLLNLDETITKG